MKFGNFTRATRRGQKYMPLVEEAKSGTGAPEDNGVWPPAPKPTAQAQAEAPGNIKKARGQAANAWFAANEAAELAQIELFRVICSLPTFGRRLAACMRQAGHLPGDVEKAEEDFNNVYQKLKDSHERLKVAMLDVNRCRGDMDHAERVADAYAIANPTHRPHP